MPPKLTHSARWKVRQYELDSLGHVNNAVYLNWIEQIAAEHADLLDVGREWAKKSGGTWVVRRHDVTYKGAAVYGDEVEVATEAAGFRGALGIRKSKITRVSDGATLIECETEWAWIKLPEGRPARIPADAIEKLGGREKDV